MLVCTFYGRDGEGREHVVSVETYGRLTPELALCHSCEQLMKARWAARAVVEEHLESMHGVRRHSGRPRVPLASRRYSRVWITLYALVSIVAWGPLLAVAVLRMYWAG